MASIFLTSCAIEIIRRRGCRRAQLSVCVSQIVKQDYPVKWPGIAEKVLGYLQSDRHDTWLGALVCLYSLVKNFE